MCQYVCCLFAWMHIYPPYYYNVCQTCSCSVCLCITGFSLYLTRCSSVCLFICQLNVWLLNHYPTTKHHFLCFLSSSLPVFFRNWAVLLLLNNNNHNNKNNNNNYDQEDHPTTEILWVAPPHFELKPEEDMKTSLPPSQILKLEVHNTRGMSSLDQPHSDRYHGKVGQVPTGLPNGNDQDVLSRRMS